MWRTDIDIPECGITAYGIITHVGMRITGWRTNVQEQHTALIGSLDEHCSFDCMEGVES